MSRTIDPFDELAAMFLSAPAPQPPAASVVSAPEAAPAAAVGVASSAPSSPTAHQPATELLIVGHLPVRAGLWLTPFADAMAREMGTIALVRMDVEEPSIQLIRGPEHFAEASLGESLDSAIGTLGGCVDVWMIRGPVGSSPVELVSSGVQQITILSSGDEAAIVAAYQLVKELALASEQAAVPLPRIGLAVVGVETGVAAAIVERLNRTTLSFLGVDVRLRACLPRMDAGIKSTRYASFPSVTSLSLSSAMDAIKRARSQSQTQSTAVGTPGVLGRIGPATTPADASASNGDHMTASPLRTPFAAANRKFTIEQPRTAPPESAPTSVPVQPVPPLREYIADPNAPSPSTTAAPVKLAPKPSMDVEPKHGVQPVEPDDHGKPVLLSTYVGGLTPLPVRCPGHERVEMAVDTRGRIQLLVKETGGQSLRELRIVESWARAHRELIGMACPSLTINAAMSAVCHVFTDQPASLADLHGTEVRLHVLAPVTVNGQVGWYAAPLNTLPR